MPDGAIFANAGDARSRAGMGVILPLSCQGVVVARGGRLLLDHVDLTVDGGGLSVIMGPNGAGKTLLLRVLANLTRPDSGTVRWGENVPSRDLAPKVGVVFQKPVLLRRSVLQNIKYALAATGVGIGERDARARNVLETASLLHLAHAPARVLSGGEQQRLALARALAAEPEVLLLDEPTSSLDPAATLAIEKLITNVRNRGTRMVLITHDIGQAHRLADEVHFMHHGRITEHGPADRFFQAPQSAPAQAFLEGRIFL
jgi:tungstate transport system ATP-binding protein